MNPAPPFFSVSLVGKAIEHVELLTERAEQRGLEDLLAATYGQIVHTLETWPREWGDPSHNYRGLNATDIDAPCSRLASASCTQFTTRNRWSGFTNWSYSKTRHSREPAACVFTSPRVASH